MVPGGLVVAEGSFAGLLIFAGVAREIAASATVVIRLATLWFGVLVGITTLFITKNRVLIE